MRINKYPLWLAGCIVSCAPLIAHGQNLTKLNKEIDNYTPVTQERLENADPKDWLHAKGRYEGWMYSELDEINSRNVSRLRPVWTYSTNLDSGHQAPAMVNDGVMFVSTPYNHVLALDAKTGQLFWRYEHDNPPDLSVMHNTNRGVALWEDKVVLASLDGKINILNAKDGQRVCQHDVGDWRVGAYITSAPVVVNGQAMVGPSGGEFGVRGFLESIDVDTCKPMWKTYSVPGPGQPGHETWKAEGIRPDAWKYGGGSMWMPGNYDADSGVLYWGVGNGSPWLGDQRPGDNLYVASVLAMNAADGDITGHFQYHWNDSWDWAGMSAPMLVDFQNKRRKVTGLLTPQRNGYLYWLERKKSGKINYVEGIPYVYNNAFKSLDRKTGRPTYHKETKPVTGKRVSYCPSLWGGKNYPYAAYNPDTGMVYIPSNDNLCNSFIGIVQEDIEPLSGQFWAGIDIPDLEVYVKDKDKSVGVMQAWNVNRREVVWTHEYGHTMTWGSTLTTAGTLVFAAGTNDRMLRAFDARTGRIVWEYPLPTTAIAPPTSYSVGGKQYIAVVAGYGVDAAWTNSVLSGQDDRWISDVPEGGTIHVFALPD